MKKYTLTEVNGIIQHILSDDERGFVSDGSHTFDEIYFHRMILFATVVNMSHMGWKSKFHDDGSMYPNYFIVGVDTPEGQFTYHYHMQYWDHFQCPEAATAPKWDGHTSSDVTRLLSLQPAPKIGDQYLFDFGKGDNEK
jgi:hypothetical protein